MWPKVTIQLGNSFKFRRWLFVEQCKSGTDKHTQTHIATYRVNHPWDLLGNFRAIGLIVNDWHFASICMKWHRKTQKHTCMGTYRLNRPRGGLSEDQFDRSQFGSRNLSIVPSSAHATSQFIVNTQQLLEFSTSRYKQLLGAAVGQYHWVILRKAPWVVVNNTYGAVHNNTHPPPGSRLNVKILRRQS